MDLTAYLQSLKRKSVGVIGIGVSNTPLLSLLLGAIRRRRPPSTRSCSAPCGSRGAALSLGRTT